MQIMSDPMGNFILSRTNNCSCTAHFIVCWLHHPHDILNYFWLLVILSLDAMSCVILPARQAESRSAHNVQNVSSFSLAKQLQVEKPLCNPNMICTLSRPIDWMKTEFRFKFAALALQFNWKMQLIMILAQSKQLSLNFHLGCHSVFNGGKFVRV